MTDTKRAVIRQRTYYAISDLVMTSLAMFVFNIVRFEILNFTTGGSLWAYLGSRVLVLEQIFVPPALMLVYFISGYYNHPFDKSRLQEFLTTAATALFNTAVIFLVFLINDPTPKRRTEYLLIFLLYVILFLFTYAGRYMITDHAIKQQRNGPPTKVVVVGNSETARKMKRLLEKSRSNRRYAVVCFVRITHEHEVDDGEPVIELDDIGDVCRRNDVEQIVIAPEKHTDRNVLWLLDRLFGLNLPVKIAPGILSYITAGVRLDDIMAQPLIDLTSPRLSDFAVNVKRTSDVALSAIAMLLLSPVFAAVAIAVKLDSPGPVFFRQERIGRRQKPFRIVKFRTMTTDAEKNGPQLSSDNDTRITHIGRVLRKYRIDEIPQFWNVIKGEMSIVGPRPEREFFVRQIVRKAPYYCLVNQVRPGITSWGMVKYGYASSLNEMVRRTKYDLIYITNMSISLDIKIMLFTVKTIFSGRGK